MTFELQLSSLVTPWIHWYNFTVDFFLLCNVMEFYFLFVNLFLVIHLIKNGIACFARRKFASLADDDV